MSSGVARHVAPRGSGGGAGTGLPPGWVSVATYMTGSNGNGNGVNPDDSAFLLARDTGQHVYIPPGTPTARKKYLVTGTVKPLEGQRIYCPQRNRRIGMGGNTVGNWDYINTMILYAGQNVPCIDLSSRHARLEGVMIMQHYAYPALAGCDAVRITDEGRPTVIGQIMNDSSYGQRIHDCEFYGQHTFLNIYGKVMDVEVTQTYMSYPTTKCTVIDVAPPLGVFWFNDVVMLAGAGATHTFHIKGCDTSRFSNLTLGGGRPLVIDGSSLYDFGFGKACAQLNFNNLQCEGSTYVGAAIAIGTGSNLCTGITVEQLETFGNGSQVYQLGVNAERCVLAPRNMYGYTYVDGGNRNQLLGGAIHSRGSLTAGTAITLNGSDAIVTGVHASDRAVGLSLGAGGTYAAITGCNFRGNTTAGTFDAGAKATGRGSANIGLTDW